MTRLPSLTKIVGHFLPFSGFATQKVKTGPKGIAEHAEFMVTVKMK